MDSLKAQSLSMNASKVEKSAKARGFGQMVRLGESMLGSIFFSKREGFELRRYCQFFAGNI